MSFLRLSRLLLVVAIAGCAFAAFRLVADLAAPDAADRDPRAPHTAIAADKTVYPLHAVVRLSVEVTNPGTVPVWVNDPVDDLFLVLEDGDRVTVTQHFPEEVLKDRQANPFIGRGDLPAARKLEPGDEMVKNRTLRLTFGHPGRYRLGHALGWSPEPRERFIPPEGRFELNALVDRFLDWQRRADSNFIELTITAP